MTPNAINPTGESVLGSLYALRDNPEAPIETPKTETAVPTPVENTPVVEKKLETPQASVETGQDSTEEDHTPLPPAIQKRVDREIAKQVSARKEAEAITARLKAQEAATPAKQGTEPVKTGADTLERPKRPTVPRYGVGTGNENETWETFQAREAKFDTEVETYDKDLTDYIVKVTESETEKRVNQKRAQEDHQAVIAQAKKDHGEDFLALTQQVADHSPIEFQHALLDIEDWPTLAVYLARNQDKLTEVVEKFKTKPIAAIETLGRMRAGLKGSSKPAETQTRTLPGPLKPVAGSGTVVSSVDLNKMAEEKPGALQSKLRELFPERVYR